MIAAARQLTTRPSFQASGRGIVRGKDVEARGGVLIAAVAALADVDHYASADGDDRREHADDEAVARK